MGPIMGLLVASHEPLCDDGKHGSCIGTDGGAETNTSRKNEINDYRNNSFLSCIGQYITINN